MFNILWNCKTIFHSAWTILHSNQECKRVLIPSKPQQQLLFSFFIYIFLKLRECVCVQATRGAKAEGKRESHGMDSFAWSPVWGWIYDPEVMT